MPTNATIAKNAICSQLRSIASEASANKTKTQFSLTLVGDSPLILQNLIHRTTTDDVDVLDASIELYDILAKYPAFNMRAVAYIDSLPYNYDERLKLLPYGNECLQITTPSNEDLAVMKLYRYNDMDKEDLLSPQFLENLDLVLLTDFVYNPDEAAASRIATPDKDTSLIQMRNNFEHYRNEALKQIAKPRVPTTPRRTARTPFASHLKTASLTQRFLRR